MPLVFVAAFMATWSARHQKWSAAFFVGVFSASLYELTMVVALQTLHFRISPEGLRLLMLKVGVAVAISVLAGAMARTFVTGKREG